MDKIQQRRDDHISHQLFPGIRYPVDFLTPDKGDHHHGAITEKRSPGGSPVAVPWDEKIINDQGNACPDEGDIHTRPGIPGELVPDGEIIVDPQEHIGKKENRYDAQALPHRFVPDELFPYIQVKSHHQEHETDGDDKELHHPGVGAGSVALSRLAEKEGFGSHPECLYEEADQEGQLVAGAIDTHLVIGLLMGHGKPLGQHDPVEGLVDHAPESRDHQRGCINDDLPPELAVKGPPELHELPAEGQELEGGRDKIGQQNITHAKARAVEQEPDAVGMRFCQPGAHGKKEIGKKDVQQDARDPDKGKLPWPVLMPQFGKRKGAQCFQPDDTCGERDVFRVIFQVDKGGDGMPEKDDDTGEKDRIGKKGIQQGIVEHAFRPFLLNVPEIGGIQGIYHHDIEERNEGIYQAHLSVFGCAGKYQGKIGGQQIVEKSCKDGAYSIPHRLPG